MSVLDDIIRGAGAFFQRRAIDEAVRVARNPGSRETVVRMSPRKFLELAEPGYSDQKMRNLPDPEQGTKWESLPYLGAYNQGDGTLRVDQHEGRHRARMLAAKGIQDMMVRFNLLEGGKGPALRWGQADDAARSAYPRRLVDEVGLMEYPMEDSLVYPLGNLSTDRARVYVPPKKPKTPMDEEMERLIEEEDIRSLINQILSDYEK
ncbi:MAG: hypothetical protein ACPF8W_00120 [Luminiphilus sp.]